MAFLPITKEEMDARGWDAPDIVVVTATPTSITRASARRLSRAYWKRRVSVSVSCRSRRMTMITSASDGRGSRFS